MDMARVDSVDYEQVSEGVRHFCAERLYELEKGLRPMVDGSFGEVLPGHLTGYLGVIKELGRLYQTAKPPRSLQDMIPMSKVQDILAGMRAAHERELEAAVARAEERVRMEVTSGSKLTIQAAKATVLTKLRELESRGA